MQMSEFNEAAGGCATTKETPTVQIGSLGSLTLLVTGPRRSLASWACEERGGRLGGPK